jgi:hypothetical protein
MSEETQTSETAVSATAPELTIVDLQNIKAILDVAASRGAFRAPEMEAIGSQYNKLNKFLEAVAPQQTAEQQAPSA